MTDWSEDLGAALADGDPRFMRAMLQRVPREVLDKAVPYLEQMARTHFEQGEFEEAVTFLDELIRLRPQDVQWHAQRARAYLKLDRLDEVLQDAARVIELQPGNSTGYLLQAQAHEEGRDRKLALNAYRQAREVDPANSEVQQKIHKLEAELAKDAALQQLLKEPGSEPPLQIEMPPLPEIRFDPALLLDASLPAPANPPMVEGLKQLLLRFSTLQSPKNAIERIEDAGWLDAWDRALAGTAGSKVLLHGSELGTFALRALAHGATEVAIAEPYALDARIASGIVQKQQLGAWLAAHESQLAAWTEEEKQASFEQFNRHVQIHGAADGELARADCDWLIFPNIDHSLLATGIAAAVRQHRDKGLPAHAKVLPGKARIFAMGIRWVYPAAGFDLQPLSQLRWSPYPQAQELRSDEYLALTEAMAVADIDFTDFTESSREIRLPVNVSGTLDGIAFWFELELGEARLSNAPGSRLRCMKPAVQHTDPLDLKAGEALPLTLHLRESRLYFTTQPPSSQLKTEMLPSWYVPMIHDRVRNEAYQVALDRALSRSMIAEPASVLDIGAGCALLSMMAVKSGARHVYGCETNPEILRIARQVVESNPCGERISLINKDCRNLKVPDELPEKANLAVFELFDCSLIGEGVLHFLAYAREHLLAEGARYLPKAARVRGVVVEYRLEQVWDIDVNLLNPYRFSQSFINIDAREHQYRALSEVFDVFEFDFATATPAPQEKDFSVAAVADGTAGAVLFWFDLQLDDAAWLSNDPISGQRLHWQQALQFMPEAAVNAGTDLPLNAKHDGSSLQFRWKQDGLPPEAFSKLPRFDPRAWQQSAELENQMRTLLQHCTAHPEEYRKVAELALRFAVDPATHGLDPKIAQRFAATLLRAR